MIRALSPAGSLCATLFVAAAALQDAPRAPELDDERRAELEAEAAAFVEHHVEVLEARDDEAVRALFVDDARFAWFTDGVLRYADADGVLDGMRAFGDMRFSTTLSDVRAVLLSAEHASVRSSFETQLAIPGADDVTYGGVITWLLERRPDTGEWRVLLGHTSTPAGPPGDEGAGGGEARSGGER